MKERYFVSSPGVKTTRHNKRATAVSEVNYRLYTNRDNDEGVTLTVENTSTGQSQVFVLHGPIYEVDVVDMLRRWDA